MMVKPSEEQMASWSRKPTPKELIYWEIFLPVAIQLIDKNAIADSHPISSLTGIQEWVKNLKSIAESDPIWQSEIVSLCSDNLRHTENLNVLSEEELKIWNAFKQYIENTDITDLDIFYFDYLEKKGRPENSWISVQREEQGLYMMIDTETTGRPENYDEPPSNTENWPRLVQIAWVIYDKQGCLEAERNKIIKPEGFEIPQEAVNVHGIDTRSATVKGENLKFVLEQLLRELSGVDAIVGHNIEFDYNIIASEMFRVFGENKFPELQKVCTMKLSTNYCEIPGYRGYKWPTLTELHHKLFGVDFAESHNALADIQATADCFWKLKELGVINKDDTEEGSYDLPF